MPVKTIKIDEYHLGCKQTYHVSILNLDKNKQMPVKTIKIDSITWNINKCINVSIKHQSR